MNLVEARKLFWPADQVPRGSVYAIVDAARDPEIETYLSALGTKETCQCLWQGDIYLRASEAAPYLVRLTPDLPLAIILLSEGLGEGWLLPFRSEAGFDVVRSHCRRFPETLLPDGQIVLFRWYDARVLNDLLPLLDAEEQRALYGPIDTIWTEGPDGDPVAHEAPAPGLAIHLPPGMFPIRPQVLAALTKRAERNVDDLIAGFLREELPERTEPIEQPRLLAWIGRMRDRAATHGVVTERGLMKWMLLAVFLGQEFDERPEFRAVLASSDLKGGGDARLETIFQAIASVTALRRDVPR
jgi:hypothetical protein